MQKCMQKMSNAIRKLFEAKILIEKDEKMKKNEKKKCEKCGAMCL